jgi:hypothetical protein
LLGVSIDAESGGKMFCETLDDYQRTMRRYILEDRTSKKYFALYQATFFYMKQGQSSL